MVQIIQNHNFLKAHNTFYPLTPHPSPVHRPTRPIPHIRSCSHLGRSSVGQSPAEYSSSEKCLLKMVTSVGEFNKQACWWGGPYHPQTWATAPKNSVGQRAMIGKCVGGPFDQARTVGPAQWAVPILFLCTVPTMIFSIWIIYMGNWKCTIGNHPRKCHIKKVTYKLSWACSLAFC